MQITISTKVWIRLACSLQHSLLLIFITLSSASAAPISRDNVRFRNYSTSEGLSQTTIRAIAQDLTGLMWFGTQDGLNRFDGYKFKTFYRDSERVGAISDNHILSLAADDARTGLWIGTQSRGLNFLDLKQERFRTYRAGQFGLDSDQINSLRLSVDGSLWLTTSTGVTHFDPDAQRVLSHLAVSGANFITFDAQGAPIVASNSGILRSISGQMKRWPDEVWPYGAAQVVTVDRLGDVWVGLASDGLLHFNRDGMLLQHFRKQVSTPERASEPAVCASENTCIDDETTLPGNEVRALMITQAGELWVSTMTGSAVYDHSARRFVRFMHDPGDSSSLPANRAQTLFEDRSHQLWVGTWRAGVAAHNLQTRSVSVIHQHIDTEDSGNTKQHGLPGNSVRAIWREPNGTLWLGILENGGLVHYDLSAGVLARFIHKPNDPTSMASNSIQAILRTRNGELWVATNGGGLNQLINSALPTATKLNSTGFIRYGTREPSPRTLNSDKILALFEDRDGTLWASSDDVGLLFRCPGCSSFEAFLDSEGQALPKTINAIFRTKKGILLLGAQGQGLIAVNSETHQIRRFRASDSARSTESSDTERSTELSHDSVTSIFETSGGAIWLGTQGGGVNHVIFEGDAFTDPVHFESVRKSDGLSSDAVGAILEDLNGNLWVSTTVGIGVIDLKTMKSQQLTESQGVDRSGYYLGAGAKDQDGSLMFGGVAGLIRFNPLELAAKPALESPVLTDMQILNLPLKLAWQNPKSPLTVATPFASSLTLSHKENMWTIEFSALDFGYADASQYQYRLLGSSPDWVDTAVGQRSATFTNLPAGRYRFEVRSVSGEYQSASTALELIALPAPWLSIWAKAFYTAAVMLLIWFFYSQVRRRITEKLRDAERIERSEALLKHALWGSRDELWDLDLRTGKMQAVNPLADIQRDRLSLTAGPIALEDLVKIAHPADRARLKLALSAHIDEGTEYFEAAFRMRTLDHDWAWVMGRGRAIERDSKGQAVRLVGTLRDISDVKAVEDELRSVNERLEDRVMERTLALSASNSELSSTLATLKNTQRQLVDSEKMASLGNLVAGVAHEINTPLGIGVTAASHLRQETERLARHLEKNTLSRSELEQFTKSAVEASDLVLKNLDRASKLVRSFKQVAVDQGSEALRTIVLANYLEEVLFTLKPTLKRTQHHIHLAIPPTLTMETYPGALSQIIFNLVTNSLTHAYPERTDGNIEISADLVSSEANASLILLTYRDDGIGMPELVRNRIFEPFFTTKRGQGGSGLGMHVVYNLVTQLLKGSIQCVSTQGRGTEIIIQIPMRSV